MRYFAFAISTISLACMSPVFAATPINLKDKPAQFLQSMIVKLRTFWQGLSASFPAFSLFF